MTRFNAPIYRWCANCNKWFTATDMASFEKCPDCGRFPTSAKCYRCQWTWNLRRAMYPGVCPKCKNPYYASARIQTRTEDRMAKPYFAKEVKDDACIQGKNDE